MIKECHCQRAQAERRTMYQTFPIGTFPKVLLILKFSSTQSCHPSLLYGSLILLHDLANNIKPEYLNTLFHLLWFSFLFIGLK